MERHLDPDRRAAAFAAARDGVLTLADALAAGLTAEQVKRRIESGRWRQVVRGVYAMAGAPDSWRMRARAAQLGVSGAGGAASHVTAAALHGLLRASLLPHVTVPPAASARCPIAKVHRSALDRADLTTVDGIRTTTVSRAIVDMAAVFDRPSLEELVDDAIVQHLAAPESILRSLDRSGRHRRGRVLLLSVLDAWTGAIAAESQAEMRLLRRLDEWGIARPVTQHRVTVDGLELRVDAAWPEAMVALEYEGVRHHAARRSEADEVRYQRLESAGWRIVPASKRDLLPGERRLPDLLARLLATSRAA